MCSSILFYIDHYEGGPVDFCVSWGSVFLFIKTVLSYQNFLSLGETSDIHSRRSGGGGGIRGGIVSNTRKIFKCGDRIGQYYMALCFHQI